MKMISSDDQNIRKKTIQKMLKKGKVGTILHWRTRRRIDHENGEVSLM